MSENHREPLASRRDVGARLGKAIGPGPIGHRLLHAIPIEKHSAD